MEIVIVDNNIASQKAAEKSGAQFEGVLHNRMRVRDEVFDAAMYSLTPANFGLELDTISDAVIN